MCLIYCLNRKIGINYYLELIVTVLICFYNVNGSNHVEYHDIILNSNSIRELFYISEEDENYDVMEISNYRQRYIKSINSLCYFTLSIAAADLNIAETELSTLEQILRSEITEILANQKRKELECEYRIGIKAASRALNSTNVLFWVIQQIINRLQNKSEIFENGGNVIDLKEIFEALNAAEAATLITNSAESLKIDILLTMAKQIAYEAGKTSLNIASLIISTPKSLIGVVSAALLSVTISISAIVAALISPKISEEIATKAEAVANFSLKISEEILSKNSAAYNAAKAAESASKQAKIVAIVSNEKSLKLISLAITSACASAAAASLSAIATIAHIISLFPTSTCAYEICNLARKTSFNTLMAANIITPCLFSTFSKSHSILLTEAIECFGFVGPVSIPINHFSEPIAKYAAQSAIFSEEACTLLAHEAKSEKNRNDATLLDINVANGVQIALLLYDKIMKIIRQKHEKKFLFSLELYFVEKAVVANMFSFGDLKSTSAQTRERSINFPVEYVLDQLEEISDIEKKNNKHYTFIEIEEQLLKRSIECLFNIVTNSKSTNYFTDFHSFFAKLHFLINKPEYSNFIVTAAHKKTMSEECRVCYTFMKCFIRIRAITFFLFLAAKNLTQAKKKKELACASLKQLTLSICMKQELKLLMKDMLCLLLLVDSHFERRLKRKNSADTTVKKKECKLETKTQDNLCYQE